MEKTIPTQEIIEILEKITPDFKVETHEKALIFEINGYRFSTDHEETLLSNADYFIKIAKGWTMNQAACKSNPMSKELLPKITIKYNGISTHSTMKEQGYEPSISNWIAYIKDGITYEVYFNKDGNLDLYPCEK